MLVLILPARKPGNKVAHQLDHYTGLTSILRRFFVGQNFSVDLGIGITHISEVLFLARQRRRRSRRSAVVSIGSS